jgi:hypothetical protein
VLLSRHIGGSTSFLSDNTGTGGGAQAHPEPDVYRVVARARVEQQAGTVLEVRAITTPSGISELFVIATGTWEPSGVGGNTRVSVQWDNDDPSTETETMTYQLAQAQDDGGAEDPAAGSAWAKLRHDYTSIVRPQAAANDSAEAAKWAEWPTLTMEVTDAGGARVVHMTVAEVPHEHVVSDTELVVTVNGIAPNLAMPVERPQTEQADGSTYDEHRYGVYRAMAVSARQSARVGPRLAHWTSYTEAGAEVDDLETPGKSFAVGTPAGEGTIPVRIRAMVKRDEPPASTAGRLRFQASPRGYLDLLIPTTLGTAWTWVTVTGWLEAPIASDDGYTVLQDFIIVDDGVIHVRYWDITYGDYPVAVP